jgi:hypothetical protein
MQINASTVDYIRHWEFWMNNKPSNQPCIYKTHTYKAGAGLLVITKGGKEKQWKSMERRKLWQTGAITAGTDWNKEMLQSNKQL